MKKITEPLNQGDKIQEGDYYISPSRKVHRVAQGTEWEAFIGREVGKVTRFYREKEVTPGKSVILPPKRNLHAATDKEGNEIPPKPVITPKKKRNLHVPDKSS